MTLLCTVGARDEPIIRQLVTIDDKGHASKAAKRRLLRQMAMATALYGGRGGVGRCNGDEADRGQEGDGEEVKIRCPMSGVYVCMMRDRCPKLETSTRFFTTYIIMPIPKWDVRQLSNLQFQYRVPHFHPLFTD